MKKTTGILSILALLLILFYLAIFASLEYNSGNISTGPGDRWPWAGKILAGLSVLIDQVGSDPLLVFNATPQGSGLKLGLLVQSLFNKNSESLVLSEDLMIKNDNVFSLEYLKLAFKDGAFNLEIIWNRFLGYLKQLK